MTDTENEPPPSRDVPGPSDALPVPLPSMRGPHQGAAKRRRLAALFLLYTGVLTLIVFWPSPVDANYSGILRRTLSQLHGAGVPGWVDYAFVETVANVMLFVPFGAVAAAWLNEQRMWLAAVGGIAASCVIETAQAALLPHRFATVYDVTANSLGAALGCLAVYAWRMRARSHSLEP